MRQPPPCLFLSFLKGSWKFLINNIEFGMVSSSLLSVIKRQSSFIVWQTTSSCSLRPSARIESILKCTTIKSPVSMGEPLLMSIFTDWGFVSGSERKLQSLTLSPRISCSRLPIIDVDSS